MRHFPEMTGHSPRKDVSKPKPLHQNVENIWWYGITKLADLCGYKGIQTPYSTTYQAEMEMTKAFFSSIRPVPFQFLKEESNTIAEEIIRLLSSDRNLSVTMPAVSRNYCENDIVYRCGIPFENSFKIDQRALFRNNVYSDTTNVVEEYLTSFAVERDMFHAFFGTFDESDMNIEYDHSQSSLPGSQFEAITTNQVNPPQDSELRMTVVLQVSPIARGARSSMEDLIGSQVPGSQVAILPSLQMSTSVVPQPTLDTYHVEGSRTDIMTRSQDSELQMTVFSSPQIG